MNTENKTTDLERTQELFDFLQGRVPEGYRIPESEVPRLSADQAWTVIWYLGNLYWQVTDHVSRCDVCGDLYDSEQEGDCLDFGDAPYHFCDACQYEDEAQRKRESVSQDRDREENHG